MGEAMRNGWIFAGVALVATGFALPAAADDFKDACVAKIGGSGPAVEQYCGCLDKGSAGNSSLRSELLSILDLPRADRPAAIAKVDGASAVFTPCVQQMRGG
ncbi:MAG: hypothetical protein H6923_04415 [Alphaproteobacteria bacterium]|nr:hypothetical protein [Alphaproteobacteria bacterium]